MKKRSDEVYLFRQLKDDGGENSGLYIAERLRA
jgi:hypothetical protein